MRRGPSVGINQDAGAPVLRPQRDAGVVVAANEIAEEHLLSEVRERERARPVDIGGNDAAAALLKREERGRDLVLLLILRVAGTRERRASEHYGR
ncbi:MAG TPA: hypothetical protein PKC49_12730 [Phycisphaerae bacterium]|nr:hypothetical protein [Phycisphaerae bacterium]